MLAHTMSYYVVRTRAQHFHEETRHSLAADHLVAVILLGQLPQRRLNDASSQAEHKVQSRL